MAAKVITCVSRRVLSRDLWRDDGLSAVIVLLLIFHYAPRWEGYRNHSLSLLVHRT